MYLITQNHVILVNIVNLKLSCLEAWFVEQYIENAEEPCLEKHSDQVMVEGKTVQHLYDTVVGQSGIGAEVCQQQHVAFYHRWSGKPGGKNKKNICLSKLLNTFKAKTIGFKANTEVCKSFNCLERWISFPAGISGFVSWGSNTPEHKIFKGKFLFNCWESYFPFLFDDL